MTNTELAILSLIVEKPRHGYEIEQVIEEREMRNWTEIGFSSIYYILKKLEKEGTIQSRPSPSEGRGPARKVYQVTEEGFKQWQTTSIDILSNHKIPASPFQLGLANLPALPQEAVIEALKSYLQQLTETKQHVLQRREMLGENPPYHVDAMFELSGRMIETELGWLEEFITQLGQREDD